MTKKRMFNYGRFSMQSIGKLMLCLAVAATVVLSLGVEAANYPNKPITMIVSYAAGGGTDVAARTVAKYAEKYLGQSIVVENRTGAGGQIGFTALARARADGYTIGLINVPAINLIAATRPGVTYKMSDFEPIANVVLDPMVLAVKADSQFKTMSDLVDYARKNPKKVVIGFDGPQTNNHLQMVVAEQALGVEFTHVPYTGAAPSLVATLGGQIDASMPSAGETLQYVENGQMRVLAVFWPTRFAQLPDCPTVKEATGVDIPSVGASSRGIGAPVGMPRDRFEILENAFAKAIADAEFLEKAEQIGLPIEYLNSADFAKLIADTDAKLQEFVDLMK